MGVAIFLLAGCMAVLPDPDEETHLENDESVKSILIAQLREWQGVRYKTGELSKSRIDCSGFVYLTYRHHFGMELPRTARGQSKSGRKVSLNQLQPGDLVFFKTGWFDRHVGIYTEDRRFVHISTKKGVILSSMEDPYWTKRYWKAVRVFR
jgi:cell wall-associated NlpC family hydrolase